MPTSHFKSTASHEHTRSNSASNLEEGTAMITQSSEATAGTASASHGTAPSKAPATSLGAGLLPLPPNITLPSPPQGYEPTNGSGFRGIVPWTAELVLLPKALQDLARFASSYASVLGGTAPPHAQLLEALTVGGAWSTMRAASAAWDAYCRDQEGSAWRLINAMMGRLRPAFALAVKGDAEIATLYPSLAELLGLKQATARRGVAARQMNAKAKAEGKPQNHGAAGKARERRALKAAALAAATMAPASPATPPAPIATLKPAGP